MKSEQLDDAITAIELAIVNAAMIDGIVGHGRSQDNRSVTLGLSTEQSAPVWRAILAALTSLRKD